SWVPVALRTSVCACAPVASRPATRARASAGAARRNRLVFIAKPPERRMEWMQAVCAGSGLRARLDVRNEAVRVGLQPPQAAGLVVVEQFHHVPPCNLPRAGR